VPDDLNQPPDDPRRPPRAEIYQEEVTWQGPIPPPEILSRMNDVVPGAAERILRQAEKEQDHRHLMQRRSQTFPLYDQIVARVSALLFAFGCLGVIWYAVSVGANIPAGVLSAAMLVAGINAFLRYRSRAPSKSRK
jgi:uncharacterized membrane protein